MSHDLVPRPAASAPAISAADVLDAFLAGRNPRTLQAYIFDLTDFARFVGADGPAAAADGLLAMGHGAANRVALAYRAHLTGRKLATATVARRLAALRSMVKVARLVGRVDWALDVEGPRAEPYRDTSGPGLDGWRKMVAKSRERASTLDKPGDRPAADRSKRDLALLRLMHDLGLRRGECVALDLADVSLEDGKVSVVGKGKSEPVRLTIPDQTLDTLREWIAARGDEPGPLFIRLDPGAFGLARLTGDSVCRMVRRLSQQAGLSREARPHGLRHQGITRLLDQTKGDVRKVQRFSRHAKVETLMRYDDSRRDDAGELARLLAADE